MTTLAKGLGLMVNYQAKTRLAVLARRVNRITGVTMIFVAVTLITRGSPEALAASNALSYGFIKETALHIALMLGGGLLLTGWVPPKLVILPMIPAVYLVVSAIMATITNARLPLWPDGVFIAWIVIVNLVNMAAGAEQTHADHTGTG